MSAPSRNSPADDRRSDQAADIDPRMGWGSDVAAQMLRRLGIPYISLNPGASYRGLHDSLVNYGNNEPQMMVCNHEEIAVQIAHGYAKACGEPLCVIVHNVVGLLHAVMGIYYAYVDRAPVFVVGATGPMDEGKRRSLLEQANELVHVDRPRLPLVAVGSAWAMQKSKVKISDIRATTVTVPLEAPLRHANGCHWGRFVRTIVEVETDNGIVGLGEMGGGGESAEAVFRAMKSYLVGHDPARLEEMRFKIANPTASLYNNRTQILAALEFACLDILGQAWGVPVSEILGGRLRDRVALELACVLETEREGLLRRRPQ